MSRDHWDVLGLRRQLALDAVVLGERYRAEARRWHPDLFATKPAAEQQEALVAATLVGDAYRVLRDRELRARYLLQREGADARPGTPPTELLQELFDLNQAIEEAADRSDAGEVARIAGEVDRARQAIDARFDEAFRAWDAVEDDAARWRALRAIQIELDRASYWRSLERHVRTALEPGV